MLGDVWCRMRIRLRGGRCVSCFGPIHTFGLHLLCEVIGADVKSSNGLKAMVMSKEGQWQELRDDCIDDVQML